MSRRPLPDHGTYARANGCPGYRPPCNCDTCVPVRRRIRKLSNVNRQLGRPGIVDAAPARQHLARLRADMSMNAIAKAVGCNRDTLTEIDNGTKKRINRSTHNKIMALRIGSQPTAALLIDATGTRRRLQALQTQGRSFDAIAESAATTRVRLEVIAKGQQPTVTRAIAERVAGAYESLLRTPLPESAGATRIRRKAEALRWREPLFWEDYGGIDDPEFDPAAVERELKRDEKAALRRADITHLADCGYEPEIIRQRLTANGDKLALSTIRTIVAEHRTGVRRDRRKKQEAAA